MSEIILEKTDRLSLGKFARSGRRGREEAWPPPRCFGHPEPAPEQMQSGRTGKRKENLYNKSQRSQPARECAPRPLLLHAFSPGGRSGRPPWLPPGSGLLLLPAFARIPPLEISWWEKNGALQRTIRGEMCDGGASALQPFRFWFPNSGSSAKQAIQFISPVVLLRIPSWVKFPDCEKGN